MKYFFAKRAQALALFSAGHSCSVISKTLKVNISTIKKWSKLRKTKPSVLQREPRHHRLGNRKAHRIEPLTKREKRKIAVFVKQHPKKRLRRCKAALAKPSYQGRPPIFASIQTISKVCKEFNVLPGKPQRRPWYSLAQRKKRKVFAENHEEDDWSHTLAADEVEVSLDGTVNVHNDFYWTDKPDQIPPHRSHKFAVAKRYFVAISQQGALEPVEYKGHLNAETYQQLLETALHTANTLFGGHEWRYLHDGAPYHTAASTQLYLETAVPSFFTREEWPVAPDANPAENVLSEVQCELADEAPGNAAALDEAFRRLFRKATTPDKLHHLFASMNERMRDIIKARGDWTDW